MVAIYNKGLERVRIYLNQVPEDRQLNILSEGHKGKLPLPLKFC